MIDQIYDYVIVGSGFGGSVSALRLTEENYSVLVLESGKRFNDDDFPRTNWNIWKYLWLPIIRCFGILELSVFKGLFVFGGRGVGGGSLVYAAVLMEPEDSFFNAPTWIEDNDWKRILHPHYQTAKRMLGVDSNPKLTPADQALKDISSEIGYAETFRPTEVGFYFGKEGEEVPDPYFNGRGPVRKGCNFCGGCMVGCRYNSKNTLPKNYLYLAEKNGAHILSESEVFDVIPLDDLESDGARYEVHYQSSTAWPIKSKRSIRARNVIFSAGVLGTHKLLLECRDVRKSLPKISKRLGYTVRSNSEAFLGAFVRNSVEDHSHGIAISSIIHADDVTQIEPVRFSQGSSLIFWLLSSPIFEGGGSFFRRITQTLLGILKRPMEFIDLKLRGKWTERGTALMIMQTEDNLMQLTLGRHIFTLFKRALIPIHDTERTVPVNIPLGQKIIRSYAEKLGGYPVGTIPEGLLDMPMTAHMLGGCLMAKKPEEGVIDENFQIHNYPGLYVIDGSIVPANPGVNPSLTITALAEYAMTRIKQIKAAD